MRAGRRGDDDDVKLGVGEEGLERGEVGQPRVVVGCRVAVLGAALENRVQSQRRRDGDERNVEDLGREAAGGCDQCVSVPTLWRAMWELLC